MELKVKSVSEAQQKHATENNKYAKEYGELLWNVALLTAYQGGGFKELQYNYEHVPMKYVKLLLDAYNYKKTEWEFLIAQAASRPHMSKRDGKDYIQKLADKLQGLDEEQGLSRFIKENT